MSASMHTFENSIDRLFTYLLNLLTKPEGNAITCMADICTQEGAQIALLLHHNNMGISLLHSALFAGNVKLSLDIAYRLAIFHSSSIDASIVRQKSPTPLMLACCSSISAATIAELLHLRHSSCYLCASPEDSILHFAFSLDTQWTSNGWTAAMFAAASSHEPISKLALLTDAGADIHRPSSEGLTVRDIMRNRIILNPEYASRRYNSNEPLIGCLIDLLGPPLIPSFAQNSSMQFYVNGSLNGANAASSEQLVFESPVSPTLARIMACEITAHELRCLTPRSLVHEAHPIFDALERKCVADVKTVLTRAWSPFVRTISGADYITRALQQCVSPTVTRNSSPQLPPFTLAIDDNAQNNFFAEGLGEDTFDGAASITDGESTIANSVVELPLPGAHIAPPNEPANQAHVAHLFHIQDFSDDDDDDDDGDNNNEGGKNNIRHEDDDDLTYVVRAFTRKHGVIEEPVKVLKPLGIEFSSIDREPERKNKAKNEQKPKTKATKSQVSGKRQRSTQQRASFRSKMIQRFLGVQSLSDTTQSNSSVNELLGDDRGCVNKRTSLRSGNKRRRIV